MSGNFDPRITAYFGDPVLRAGFMPVPHLLMRHYIDLNIGADHAMFAMQLMELTWDLAQPPNTMKKLAARMGVSIRTAQRYSEHLVEQGLLIVYEQFQDGAQVENGYDLSPLFKRLATFAPEPPLIGTPRERRVRDTKKVAGHDVLVSPSLQTGHVTDDIPPRDILDAPPHDSGITAAFDTPDTPPMSTRSGLKRKPKKPLKNNQEEVSKKPHGSSVTSKLNEVEILTKATTFVVGGPGCSLRWNIPLSVDEVDISRALLDRLGIHSSIASAAAVTLAPAEVWSLATYSTAARLGPGWIAKQIYDFQAKRPRPTDLASRYNTVGRALATLEETAATRLLDLVDRHWPHELERLERDPFLANAQQETLETLRMVWSVMVEVRGEPDRDAHAKLAPLPAMSRTPETMRRMEYEQLWQSVLARLAPDLSRDTLATWLKPTMLLDLQGDIAVVSTPNTFVRDEVEARYKARLADILALELGRPISIECVIGELVAV